MDGDGSLVRNGSGPETVVASPPLSADRPGHHVATANEIKLLVVRQALAPVLLGGVIGLVLASSGTSLVTSLRQHAVGVGFVKQAVAVEVVPRRRWARLDQTRPGSLESRLAG